jgi:hypothetical protein
LGGALVKEVSPSNSFQAGLSSAYVVTLFVLSPIAANCYAAVAVHWQLTSGEWVLWGSGVATTLVYSA